MRDIEYDRACELLHDRDRSKIHDKVVVTEGTATLGQDHFVVSRFPDLPNRMLHVCGSDELSLLDVDDLSRSSGSHQEVGLAAQERRDLKHVENLGRLRGVRGFMDVGQNRNADFTSDIREYFEAFLQTGPRNEWIDVRFALS